MMLQIQNILRHPARMLPILICLVGAATTTMAIVVLLFISIDEEKERLMEIVQSQAGLMEAVADFDRRNSNDHPQGAFEATMEKISMAHKNLAGFGETGEFVIGKMLNGKAAILHQPRYPEDINFEIPDFIPIPMQKALAGESGEIIATDYKGNKVLAAYVPVSILDIGLVAKIDIDELYRPFIITGGFVAAITLILFVMGVFAARLFSSPFELLEQEKKRAEDYLNIAGALIVALDKNGVVTMINHKGSEILGRDKHDLVGKNWFEEVIADFQIDEVMQAFKLIMSGDLELVEKFENYVLTNTGEKRLIAWHNSYLKDEYGNIIGCLCAGEDITGRAKMENNLRVSEERFTKSQKFANIGTWDWDIRTGELYWSDQIAPLFGYEIGALQTTYENFVSAIHPDDRQAVTDAVNACIQDGVEYNIEHRAMWPDGTVRWLLEKGDVVRDEDGQPLNMLGVVQDITENKNMQVQLIQSSKMATLGEMATGVAHELNQPLNVVKMAVNNIHRKLIKNEADPDYLNDKLDKIGQQVDRAAAIIDHMRIFGRRSDMVPSRLDPKRVIDDTLDLIGEQLRLSGVDVRIFAPEICSSFLGHQVQVEQVFLNLLGNARDQLKDIEGKKYIEITLSQDDENIQIAIEDNAGGMEENVLPHVFEPFFTTKEVGAGTGLGLSISYGIITDMGGSIVAENAGKGARFTISLPIHDVDKQ